MKKWITTANILAAILMLVGCGSSFQPSATSLYIQQNGKITYAIVSSFEKEYYSSSEFEGMMEREVDAFNSQYSEPVLSIERLDVENDTLYLLLNFEDADVYSNYSEEYCFVGTVEAALDEGLSFNMDFKDLDYEEYTTTQVTENKNNSVAVFQKEGLVQTEKPIKYVSNNVEMLSDHLVEIMPIDDSDEFAYIIY